MTKEQLETKLALLPLQQPVLVSYGFDFEDVPVLQMNFDAWPGPGLVEMQIPLNPSENNLRDVINNLPLREEDRLASLAIMLTASLFALALGALHIPRPGDVKEGV